MRVTDPSTPALPAFLQGERIYLRGLTAADADGPYPGWLNDATACAGNSHHVYPYTREKAVEYLRHAATTDRELILAVVRRSDDRHIGNVALSPISMLHRTAEFTILIGDVTAWGQGYGLEAGRLLFAHAFTALGLQRIGCGTYARNAGMQKLATALGMTQEGVRRRAIWKAGEYDDIIEYGILSEEFQRA